MPKPGNVSVTTEVGYCPFCGRTRNLRREERRLGGLVRATLECESCHRTLSSTMGPVPEPPAEQAAPQVEEAKVDAATQRRREPAKKPATAKKQATTKKPAAARKPAAKKPAAAKPAAKKPAAPTRKPAPRKKG